MKYKCAGVCTGFTLAFAMMATLAPGQPGQINPAVQDAYSIPVGKRLKYETSGSLIARAGKEEKKQAQLKTQITILSDDADGKTALAEIDLLQPDATAPAAAPGNDKIVGRCTFVLPPEGIAPGQKFRSMGVLKEGFPMWSLETLFPVLPKEGTTSGSVPIAVIDDVTDALTTTTRSGTDFQVKIATDSATASKEKPALDLSYTYSSADKSLKQHNAVLSALVVSGRGEKLDLNIQTETRLTGIDTVTPSELDALKKEAAAAAPLMMKLQSFSPQDENMTSEVLGLVDGILKAHPKGAFSEIFTGLQSEIKQMQEMQAAQGRIKDGEEAPDFQATTLDGKPFKLSGLRGRVVVLDFWATWCGPCVREIPNMKSLFDANKDKEFSIVGISADHEESALRDFIASKNLGWTHIYEQNPKPGSAMSAYAIQKFPTIVVIDRGGKIRGIDLFGEDLEKKVSELLSEQKAK